MSNDTVRPMKVHIHKVTREYDGFFRIDRLSTSHERYEGGMHRFDWLVFERGNSVAVILYKTDSKEIILVRQFRAPTLKYRRSGDEHIPTNDGQLDETIAGMPREGETLEDCAIREIKEEAGYIVKPTRLQRIAQFYASPGGTSERIFLYYAEVTDADRDPNQDQRLAGVQKDGESILVRHVPVSTFFAEMIDPNLTIDSKVLIASMLLRDRLGQIPTAATQPAPTARRRYVLKNRPDFSIVLRTGNMLNIDDVDAWVNSENTDMEMDRFIGTSVSALIRYHGAAKNEHDRVIEDTIADALKTKMRGRYTSNIGTVHDTTSGHLKRRNKVKRLFHVAAVNGIVGKGSYANPALIEDVTRKALAAIEKRNNAFGISICKSALVPMIGTGDQGVAAEISFPEILKGILAFYESEKSPKLRSVHVSAFKQHDADVAMQCLDLHPLLVFRP
jgi:nudix-type nucleoside diphosphatase (YffH/AdpP family)